MDYKKFANICLWVLLLIGAAIVAVFFGMGDEAEGYEVAGDILAVPKATGLFMAWNYILGGISLLATFVFVVMGFLGQFKVDPKKATTTLCVLVAFALLFVVCWALGSGEKIEIIGYDGTDNEGVWANLADMMMYVTYTLVFGTIAALIWGVCYTKLKK